MTHMASVNVEVDGQPSITFEVGKDYLFTTITRCVGIDENGRMSFDFGDYRFAPMAEQTTEDGGKVPFGS